MKNKLWVFGCSLSTGFRGSLTMVKDELTWPGVLAEKLDMELVNQAHAGQCNWVSILQFIDRRDEFKKGDKIMFEFTFFDRYNIYPTRAQLIDIKEYIIRNKGTLAEMNKDMRDNNFKWFKKHVFEWCVDRGVEIYFWSIEGQTHLDFKRYDDIINFVPAPNSVDIKPNYSFYTKWQDQIEEQWVSESDKHFNEHGHSVLGNYFYEFISEVNYNYVYTKLI